jgi:hypothetical protein
MLRLQIGFISIRVAVDFEHPEAGGIILFRNGVEDENVARIYAVVLRISCWTAGDCTSRERQNLAASLERHRDRALNRT